MAVLEHDIAFTSKDAGGNQIIYHPITKVDNVDGAVASINNITPDANGNVTIDLGDNSNGSMPLGHVFFSIAAGTPNGAVEAMGEEISRETYNNLWTNYVQDSGLLITELEWQAKFLLDPNNVPYYSDGDGATTFRVPQLGAYAVMSCKRGIVPEHKGRYCIVAYSNITNAGNLDVAEVMQGLITLTSRVTTLEKIKITPYRDYRERSSNKYTYGQS